MWREASIGKAPQGVWWRWRAGGGGNFGSNTYRAVYTVKFAGVVYVLHAFQKKSKRGSSTPRHDVGLIGQRLKTAEQHYQQYYRKAG
jgi:Phage derived protein Gp49-like (DUF891)